jgi:electron transport complex protein RnfG
VSTVAEPSYRKRIGYQAGLLGGFATLAAALLIVGNNATYRPIAQRQAEDLLESLSQVLPDTIHDNRLLDNAIMIEADGRPVTIYRALKDQHLTGFAFQTTGYGYAGAIQLLLGIDPQGELLGVRVLAHAETPGLGDRIEAAKDDWILGFKGRSLANTPEAAWHVRKDGGEFDAFSGATITPRAVVKAVHDGLLLFNTHRDQLVVLDEAPNAPGEVTP